MKIRSDENVSPHIVEAVRNMALNDRWEFTSVYDVGDTGKEDEHWITLFAKQGGDAIISGDKDFIKLYPQVKAVFDTGMKVIHLPSKWSRAKGRLQAAFILQWWSRIEETIRTMNKRECYRPFWNIKESGELKKIKIDFHTAQKRTRKAAKREQPAK